MKAVRAALAMISGAYQTTILTYFLQRNLFLALVKVRLFPHIGNNITNSLEPDGQARSLFKTVTD